MKTRCYDYPEGEYCSVGICYVKEKDVYSERYSMPVREYFELEEALLNYED